MQRWELKEVWVELEIKTRVESERLTCWTVYSKESERALEEAKRLAIEGWELVSVLPRLQSSICIGDDDQGAAGAGMTTERGYHMFFKRPLHTRDRG